MMPSNAPTTSARPSSIWDRPSSQLAGMPSASPSTKSSQPSYDPSTVPSISAVPTKKPSSAPTEPADPTPSPVDTMTIQRQAYDPCARGGTPLVGATVSLYTDDEPEIFVDQTVTDSEGSYIFEGLPMGRYVTYVASPDCGRRELSNKAHASPVSLPDDHTIEFYKSGDLCEIKFGIGSGDIFSTADFTHFDTLDECCANMFWYDIDGCFSRSHVAFQFEFCVDISGFSAHSNCPLDEIRAIEMAMQKGLGNNSELALVEFGSTMLINDGGETKCIGPTIQQDHMSNQLRGLIGPHEANLNICGVVLTKEADCREETCLRDAYDKVVGHFQGHFYSGVFSSVLHSLARDDLRPLLDFQAVEIAASSFTTRKLLLPSTVPTEDEAIAFEYSVTTSDVPHFYPTYISGQLCHSKTLFESWEQSHGTLKECCEAHFSWDFEACCSSLNMGGC